MEMTHAQTILDSVHRSDPMGFWTNKGFDPKKVVDFMEFNRGDVARIANVKTNTVRYDDRIPKAVIDHIQQIANICSLVAEIFDADIVKTQLWLDTPNPAIGDISPKQMMRFGRYEKLLKFVLAAKENTPD
jgi:hypothetical protein